GPVRPRKKKVTLGLDEDVARWFQRLGAGYHGRINAVLRTYMLALISKEVLSRPTGTGMGMRSGGRRSQRRRRIEGARLAAVGAKEGRHATPLSRASHQMSTPALSPHS